MRVERLSVSVVNCRFLVQKRSSNPEQDGPAFGPLLTSEMFWRELTTAWVRHVPKFCVRDVTRISVMTLSLPLALWNEVYLNVGDVGAASQKVVTDQTVEVIWRGCADIHLIIGHFRNSAHIVGNLTRHRGSLFERGTLGHIDNHLKLALAYSTMDEKLSQYSVGSPPPKKRIMTLSLPLAFWNEVYLDVGDVGTAPQKVVTDQTIEVIW